MRLSFVAQVAGRIVRLFGAAFVLPAAVAAGYGEWADIGGFLAGGAASIAVGQLLVGVSGGAGDDLRRIEALAVVSGVWLVLAPLCAVPYLWSGLGVVDALFEAMSGITTTGATILTDFEAPGRGLFFWRALTEWLGGMGVIALVVAVLPRLADGVRQLFFAEVPGPAEEKLGPHIRKTAAVLWYLYAGLTAAATTALFLAGMPLLDAVCHAMTTLAAGGFSPHPQSIMGYDSAAVEWIVCVFMFLAGANFALQYRALRGHPGVLFRDDEFRVYAGIVVGTAAFLALLLWQVEGDGAPVRRALFQVLSILTTTGFSSTDFDLWGDQAKVVLLAMMFIGGCAGSAAGGPKVLRHMLAGRFTLVELRRTFHPHGVLPVKLGGKVVPEVVIRSVLVFFVFYVVTFAVCVAVVIEFGSDLETAITATAATLGNIGPGFGEVGPLASYGELHPVSKLTLTAAMWIGRLEVVTVLALLRIEVWTNAHWRPIAPPRWGRESAP